MPRIKNDRKAISDAAGQSIDNQFVNLEMQKWKQVFVITRSLFYAANTLVSQLAKGGAFNKYPLKETYHITLMDFFMDERYPENPVRTVKLNVQENGDVFYNNLIFKYIEIPKFKKSANALTTRLDKWLYALKNMALFKQISLILEGDPIFEKLFEIARISNLNNKEMTAYMKAQMDRWDYNRGLEVSKEEGLVEGIEKGLEQGLEQGLEKGHLEEKIRTAEKMLLKKLSLQLIGECTELTHFQLLQIADKLKIVTAD